MFQELPFEYVDSKDLAEVAKAGCESSWIESCEISHRGMGQSYHLTLCLLRIPAINKVYGAVVSREDHWKRVTDGGFDYGECDEFPERYYSSFAKDVRP